MINITEDKTIIAYTVRVRRPGKGTYDSIYVFGNSPEEFVQNLKDQLKERGYGSLSKMSAIKIKNNLEKQLQQFQELEFTSEGKIMKKSLSLKTALKEGTWAIPKTPQEVNKAISLLKDFNKLKQKLYKVLGDDILFDHLDDAIKRMNELIQTSYNNFGK